MLATATATAAAASTAANIATINTSITTTMTTTNFSAATATTVDSSLTRAQATAATAAAAKTTTRPTTTITSDPGILCFHHCNVKVFCFALPRSCPSCKQELATGDDVGGGNGNGNGRSNSAGINELGINRVAVVRTKLLPFRLPYPFVRASQSPCAVVLRPTMGDFLNDYNNATDLHIAITTSTGCVVEFDRHGLRRHRADNMPSWWQCLLVGDVPEPWYDYWDQVLLQLCNEPDRWTVSHYHEDTHNCYTFVLAFLQTLAYDKLSAAARTKTSFCEKYIVPRTTTAGKYISLYRKLRDAGIYVHPHHQQHLKQRAKSRLNGHHNAATGVASSSSIATTATLSNGHGSGHISNGNGKASGIILRVPNLCTIEE